MKKLISVLGMVLLAISITYSQSNKKEDHVIGDMIVQLNDGANIRTLINKAPDDFKLSVSKYLSSPMRVWLLNYDEENNNYQKMQNWLYSQKEVSLVDLNVYVDLRATTPGDPNFNQQWHHVNTGANGGTADADIDSDLAWDITTGGLSHAGDSIVVCMIESGNLDHIDIAPNRWRNYAEIPGNGIDDDGNGYVDDYNGWNPVANNDNYGTGGHGTNCLGMIGAKGDNNSLVVGANWNVKLMVVGDYDANTQAAVIEAYTYPLIMRRRWNASNGASGAFVVATSASWGLDGVQASTRPIWCQFYDTLGKAGILNVGATTNNDANVETAGDVPTGCTSPYMIGVGRTDYNDQWEGGYGTVSVDFGAPGVNVLTTDGTNGTTVTTGTSFSCPLTAGVIGLAYSIPCDNFIAFAKTNPQAAADSVRSALMRGVDVKPHLANRYRTSGRLNAKNTLDILMNSTCSSCQAPSISANITSDSTASLSFTASSGATSSTVYWRIQGAANWTQINNATSPINLTGLTECTTYEYYSTSTCGSETSGNSAVNTFKTTGCGSCVELSYCSSTTTSPADEWIDNFTINGYTNNSGQNNGYGDFTSSSSINLNKNQAYPFTVTPAWGAGGQYDELTRIWVDLNHDGDFEDAGEMVYNMGTANQNVVNGSITIPATATSGNTRMRIQMAYQGSGQDTPPAICGNFQWGEVEDYCVNIVNPVSCNLNITSGTTNVACNGASTGAISITNVSGGTPTYTYAWSNNLGSNSSVSNIGAGNYSVTISDNTGCDTTLSFTISEASAINVSGQITNPDCNGANTGGVATTISGGTPGYTYAWSGGGGTGQNLISAGTGNYTITVTDSENCVSQSSFFLVDPVEHNAQFNSSESDLTITLSNTSVGGGAYSWTFGDGNTSTDENPVHTYSENGEYIVCLEHTTSCGTFNNCDTINVMTSGVEDFDASKVEVYPNPSNGLVNFKIDNSKIELIEFTDLSGRVIKSVIVNSTLTIADLKEFAEGSYLYRLKDHLNKIVLVDKIVITK